MGTRLGRPKRPWTAEKVAKVQAMAELYRQTQCLESVGKAYGVTRERIRQLLNQGVAQKVCTYRPKERMCKRLERMPEALKTAESFNELSKGIGFSATASSSMSHMIEKFGLDVTELKVRMYENRMRRLRETLWKHAVRLGVETTFNTTRFQRDEEARKFLIVYQRSTGQSIEQIRESFGLKAAKLPSGNYVRQVRTHCRYGHALEGRNVYQFPSKKGVVCRTCMNRRQRERYARKRAGLPGRSRTTTACRNGHPWTPENVYVHKTGRFCRTCRNAQQRAHYAERKRRRDQGSTTSAQASSDLPAGVHVPVRESGVDGAYGGGLRPAVGIPDLSSERSGRAHEGDHCGNGSAKGGQRAS